MPRPRLCRRISYRPSVTFFKPAGIRLTELEQSVLTFDEMEALRLKDYQGMDQAEAAKKMNISQPTFHRLITEARKKIADALVNGKSIRINGGVFEMADPDLGHIGMRRHAGGPSTECMCPKCGAKQPKQRGVPCASIKCPKCGARMTRG